MTEHAPGGLQVDWLTSFKMVKSQMVAMCMPSDSVFEVETEQPIISHIYQILRFSVG